MKASPPLTGVARRVERACRHVSDLWFPADPTLVSRLRSTLTDPKAPRALDDTLQILEGDYALFMFALKGLLKMLAAEGVALPDFATPRDILETAGLERLREVLDESDEQVSRHSLSSIDAAQISRMREAVVSASASATLAKAQQQNSELGFFSGLLRQLGLTLIAWNYPGVYQRATQSLQSGKSLDEAITEQLGFSPSTLAVALSKEWRLPSGLQEILTDEFADSEDLDKHIEVSALGQSLRELCRVGEALARANEPETYPSAQTDWEFASQAIEARLGPDGLRTVREAIEDRFDHLLVQMPSFFRGGTILDPEAFLARHHEQEMGIHNPLLKACRLHVQERILELYHGLAEGQSTQALLRKFASTVVPSCGFSGGVVYTVDPGTASLTPQLRVGTLQLRTFSHVSLELEDNEDFVAVAYKSDQPIARVGQRNGESEFATLGSVFGYSQRVGVLYLEIPEIVFTGSEKQHTLHLRALAITLTDILRLG